MNCIFKKDLYRYYGESGEPFLKRIFRPLELKYISLFRKANTCKFKPLQLLYMLKLKRLSNKTKIQIPARTTIGEGLYIGHLGRIIINPNDSEAVNLYERVKRGDVDQCSFGFEIVSEETDFREDGSIHWTITEVNLFEVSACTFPAYKDTNISARSAERDEIKARELMAWKEKMRGRLEHGSEDPASEEAH